MTETTQPDPPVPWAADPANVDCPDCYARAGEPCTGDDSREVNYFHIDRISDAPAARNPLTVTVADIPAGQGPASVYIGPDIDGDPTAWFKTADGGRERLYPKPWHSSPAENALWALIEAHVPPHVTTEED